MKPISTTFRVVFAATFAAASYSTAGAQGASPAFTPPSPHQKQVPAVEKHLKVFDVLDFDVFSNQKWNRLAESHAKDIVVTWPDGHVQQADANRRWQDDSTNRKVVQAGDGDDRPLEGRHDGS